MKRHHHSDIALPVENQFFSGEAYTESGSVKSVAVIGEIVSVERGGISMATDFADQFNWDAILNQASDECGAQVVKVYILQ